MKFLRDLFLNEKAILCVIILNSVLLFLQESGVSTPLINVMDVGCTIIFIIEMVVKLGVLGFKKYWRSGWNRLDGTLVVLSIPSLVVFFMPNVAFYLSFLLALRVLRVFRFFRLVHAFPGFTRLMNSFGVAMKRSYAVFLGMLVMIVIFAMIGCGLFRDAAPEYFSTPLDAIYATFRIFTGEGWNEIPDAVAQNMSSAWGHVIRLYFCLILIVGCIVGMSLLNSVFVDAMVSNGDTSIDDRLDAIDAKLEEIKKNMK